MSKFADYCDQLRMHVNNSENNSEDSRVSLDAIDCFVKIIDSRDLSEENIRKIMLATRSPHIGPYYIGTELLLTLHSEFPSISTIWYQLANSNSAHDRWVVTTAIRDERISFDLALELNRKFINDKSSKVRRFAIENVYIRCLDLLLPELRKRAEIEKNKKVLHYIEWVTSRME